MSISLQSLPPTLATGPLDYQSIPLWVLDFVAFPRLYELAHA